MAATRVYFQLQTAATYVCNTKLLSAANMLFVSTNVCSHKTVLSAANMLFVVTHVCSHKTVPLLQTCLRVVEGWGWWVVGGGVGVVGGEWLVEGWGWWGWVEGWGWWVFWFVPSPLVQKVLSNANFKIFARIITVHVACFCSVCSIG